MKTRLFSFSIVLLAAVVSLQGQVQVYRYGGGYLGVDIRDVNSDDVSDLRLSKESGVVVERVAPDSAAEQAGLQEGDVVLEYAGIPVLGVRHFQRLVSETPQGREVEIVISRDGSRQSLNAKVGQRKAPRIDGFITPEGELEWRGFDWEQHLPDFFRWDGESRPDSHITVLSSRPRLGISGTPLTSQLADFLKVPSKEGILVTEVIEGSAAQKGGLRAGDVIVSVDGDSIATLNQLSRSLRNEEVDLEVYRDGRSMTVNIEMEAPRKIGPRRRL